jgi:hypothetical protein
MKHKGFVTLCLTLSALSIYLLVSAPVPLEATAAARQATVPIERVFDAVNAINARARQIYTKEIVGAGKAAGLAFDEDWQEDAVQAGPLPALFLRGTAAALERDPFELGLFLGSDYPINPSNRFSAEQLARFEQVKTDRQPRYGQVAGEGTMFGMYADVASAQPCVTCHNDHRDTPKTNWRLDDIMGATTWTFPRQMVSADEYVGMVDALYRAIAAAYGTYLAEVGSFDRKPVIGDKWPRDGFFLPSAEVFMAAIREATAAAALTTLTRDVAGSRAAPGPVGRPDAAPDTPPTEARGPGREGPALARAEQPVQSLSPAVGRAAVAATAAGGALPAAPAAADLCVVADQRELCF